MCKLQGDRLAVVVEVAYNAKPGTRASFTLQNVWVTIRAPYLHAPSNLRAGELVDSTEDTRIS